MSIYVVTANRILDGRVVYLGPDRNWSEEINDALQVKEAEQRDQLLDWALAQEGEVCGPYPLPVESGPDGVQPLSARERYRAAGPSAILRRFGYQALPTQPKGKL